MGIIKEMLIKAGLDASTYKIGRDGSFYVVGGTGIDLKTPRIPLGHGSFKISSDPNRKRGAQGNGHRNSKGLE